MGCDSIPVPCEIHVLVDCDGSSDNVGALVDNKVAMTETTNGGTITRTGTHSDACGNQETHTQIITVKDTTAPLLSRTPSDVTVDCDCDAFPAVTVEALDNCPPKDSLVVTTTS